MKRCITLLALTLLPTLAHAHTGVGATHGFLEGVNHPIHGLDHLLAMLAVGLWAAQLGGRAIWAVPSSFLALMVGGGFLGMAGFRLPFLEEGILASVLLLGILVAVAARPPVWIGAAVVGFFALFHGVAHGAEIPAHASGLLYAGGFLMATATIHALGIGLGMMLKAIPYAPALRIAGAAVLVAGGVLAFS